jgi:hypothetical protein
VRRLFVAIMITCLGALALPATAGAGQVELDVDLVSPVEPLTFSATLDEVDCDAGSIDLVTLTLNGGPVEPVSVTEDPADPNTLLIVLPSDSAPGELLAVVSCTDGGTPIAPQTDVELFSTMTVTKVVEGTPPPDTTFLVNFDCVNAEVEDVGFDGVSAADLAPDFAVDLEYGATGGLAYVYSDHPVDCTVTEPEDGGALSVVIDPEVVQNREPIAYEATVTNTFPSPIVVEPTFTG